MGSYVQLDFQQETGSYPNCATPVPLPFICHNNLTIQKCLGVRNKYFPFICHSNLTLQNHLVVKINIFTRYGWVLTHSIFK